MNHLERRRSLHQRVLGPLQKTLLASCRGSSANFEMTSWWSGRSRWLLQELGARSLTTPSAGHRVEKDPRAPCGFLRAHRVSLRSSALGWVTSTTYRSSLRELNTLARRKRALLVLLRSVTGDNKHAIALGRTLHSCRDILAGMVGMDARLDALVFSLDPRWICSSQFALSPDFPYRFSDHLGTSAWFLSPNGPCGDGRNRPMSIWRSRFAAGYLSIYVRCRGLLSLAATCLRLYVLEHVC